MALFPSFLPDARVLCFLSKFALIFLSKATTQARLLSTNYKLLTFRETIPCRANLQMRSSGVQSRLFSNSRRDLLPGVSLRAGFQAGTGAVPKQASGAGFRWALVRVFDNSKQAQTSRVRSWCGCGTGVAGHQAWIRCADVAGRGQGWMYSLSIFVDFFALSNVFPCCFSSAIVDPKLLMILSDYWCLLLINCSCQFRFWFLCCWDSAQ